MLSVPKSLRPIRAGPRHSSHKPAGGNASVASLNRRTAARSVSESVGSVFMWCGDKIPGCVVASTLKGIARGLNRPCSAIVCDRCHAHPYGPRFQRSYFLLHSCVLLRSPRSNNPISSSSCPRHHQYAIFYQSGDQARDSRPGRVTRAGEVKACRLASVERGQFFP